jgi:branched-chain amino acid transport system substrate-binding protein
LNGCVFSTSLGALPTLKIGLVAPFEGLDRALGYEVLFAVKLAIQERNQNGGLNGYRVELVALNDFDDPADAALQARALRADPDVLGVVGHLSSAASLAALPVYQEANLAVSIPWTVAATGSEIDQAGVVSLAANAGETAARLAAVTQQMGLDKVVKLSDNDIDHLNANLQGIQLETGAVTAGEIVLALQAAGISVPLFGQVEVGSPQLTQVAATAADGLIFVSPGPNPADVAEAAAFSEAYRSLAGFPPGPRAILAYDATQVLLDAIEQAMAAHQTAPTRTAVRSIIAHVRRQGLTGQIAFDAQGWRIDAPVWVYQISGGQYPGRLVKS